MCKFDQKPLILQPLNAYRMCIKVGGKLWERIVIIETSQKSLDKHGLKTIIFCVTRVSFLSVRHYLYSMCEICPPFI